MNQYIITGEERKKMLRLWSIIQTHISYEQDTFYNLLDQSVQDAYNLMESIRSHPYNPQAEREKVLDELDFWIKQQPYHVVGYTDLLKEKIEELRKGGERE